MVFIDLLFLVFVFDYRLFRFIIRLILMNLFITIFLRTGALAADIVHVPVQGLLRLTNKVIERFKGKAGQCNSTPSRQSGGQAFHSIRRAQWNNSEGYRGSDNVHTLRRYFQWRLWMSVGFVDTGQIFHQEAGSLKKSMYLRHDFQRKLITFQIFKTVLPRLSGRLI